MNSNNSNISTPIKDFVSNYSKSNISRMHMPGHKGAAFLGLDKNNIMGMDITEIKGADSLYHADGIIAESEANATKIFETGKTIYSTEGSSLCIKTMLYLALLKWREKRKTVRPVIIAARNVHISFIHAAMLLDFDVKWLWPTNSILACNIDKLELEEAIKAAGDALVAVYVTSPDYLGNVADIKSIADIVHKYKSLFLVDNAHGAYLKFISKNLYSHPISLGADICCDSAHKTLPVLTGGAYLHMSDNFDLKDKAKYAMNIFGSTSPSYLILSSLDICNKYISETLIENLQVYCDKLQLVKIYLSSRGWTILETDPLKITICSSDGNKLADKLRDYKIECEYSDNEYVVLMLTPENGDEDLVKLQDALEAIKLKGYSLENCNSEENSKIDLFYTNENPPVNKYTIREASMMQTELVAIDDAEGRICAAPLVSCPPAIPIVVSGEIIDKIAIDTFKRYNVDCVMCVKE